MNHQHTNTESALCEGAVLAAAQQLIAAFARHDTPAYFSAFSADATFAFHSHAERLTSRSQYQALWQTWEQALGFRVLSCNSSTPSVQLCGSTAIFLHDVQTTIHTDSGDCTLNERETIVFVQQTDGRWLAVHEHLSPLPAAAHEMTA